MQDSLFRIDHGEVRVVRKTFVGHMRDFIVMLDALPTAFFVESQNKFDFFLGNETFVFEFFERKESGNGGTLVVHGAPSPDSAVFDESAEGRLRPAASRRHDVEVR